MLDLYRGNLSLRRLCVLLRFLPQESATARIYNVENTWTPAEYLLANVIDVLSEQVWVTIEMNRSKGRQSKPPEPFPRPGDPTTSHQNGHREGRRVARDRSQLPHLSGDELDTWLKNGATHGR